MAADRPRYLKVRCFANGRGQARVAYYWAPRKADAARYGLPQLQRLAVDRPTRDGDGSAYHQAWLEAEEWNAKLDRLRASDGAVADPASIPGTLPFFIAAFRKTVFYTKLSEATRRGTYEYGWRIVLKWSEALGHIPVKRITVAHCLDLYENLSEADDDGYRSLARAKNAMASLRRILSYAVKKGEIKFNPAVNLELQSPDFRTRIWEPDEIAAFVAQAKKAGRPSLALAVALDVVIGQRRSDTIALRWTQYENGCVSIVQKKTGARIRVPVTPELRARLAQAPRHASGHIVYDEVKDRPYTPRAFNAAFREIADAAGLFDLWCHDLRRTAVVALAHAGATVPEIIAVTGHSLENATRVLKHYLFPDSEMAEAAILKLINRQATERRRQLQLVVHNTEGELDLSNVVSFAGRAAA